MSSSRAKILIIVEGARREVRLMKKMLDVFSISDHHEIVSYGTNIYALYHEMFDNTDPESMDLLQVLKSREKDPEKRALLEQKFSDVLLIFDFDPQDRDFSDEKIIKMQNYFRESSDMGKLYINYPMAEAFYHMSEIPDPDYDERYVSMDELRNHEYKERVGRECVCSDYKKYAASKEECSMVIRQNINKANKLTGCENRNREYLIPEYGLILERQLRLLANESTIAVLCTCCFYIAEFNSHLIDVNVAWL